MIAAAISSVHISAGKIPDPEFDIAKSLPVLTAHHEALVATEQFLQHSDLPDKEDAIFQSNPVNDLILLMPDRVRISHQDEMFQNSSCTSGAAKARHQAFGAWVRQTRSKLLIWDVETQATTKVHHAMVGTLVEPVTAVPLQQMEQHVEKYMSILLAKHPQINQAQSSTIKHNHTQKFQQKCKQQNYHTAPIVNS